MDGRTHKMNCSIPNIRDTSVARKHKQKSKCETFKLIVRFEMYEIANEIIRSTKGTYILCIEYNIYSNGKSG